MPIRLQGWRITASSSPAAPPLTPGGATAPRRSTVSIPRSVSYRRTDELTFRKRRDVLPWSARTSADGRGTMGAALSIRDDLPPEALRRQARQEANRRAALRMLACHGGDEPGGSRQARRH